VQPRFDENELPHALMEGGETMGYEILRQLDLLCYRADRLKAGPCREALVVRIERLVIDYVILITEAR
jgi:hypothetical protein